MTRWSFNLPLGRGSLTLGEVRIVQRLQIFDLEPLHYTDFAQGKGSSPERQVESYMTGIMMNDDEMIRSSYRLIILSSYPIPPKKRGNRRQMRVPAATAGTLICLRFPRFLGGIGYDDKMIRR